MRKKFILLLFLLIFLIKQEEVVYSETETVSSQAEIIEPYVSTGLNLRLIDPYYIEAGANFNYQLPILEAKDRDGYPVPLSNINYAWKDKAIDTSKQGDSAIANYFRIGEPFITFSTMVKVAYNLVLETKNTTIYEGQVWNPETNLVKAYDEDSNPVYYYDDRIKKNNAGPTDVRKPGSYLFTYTLVGKLRSISSSFYVIVKEDKTKAELKDTELYVGQKWDLGSVLKNVVDKDGNPIKPEEVNYVSIDGNKTREIDTSKPGKHTVSIAILKANNKWVYSNDVTVTVKEDKTKAELKDTELYVGQKWDLGSVYKNVVDKDGNPISVEQIFWVKIDGKWIDLRKNKTKELIDTSKPGKHTVQIAVRNANENGHYPEWVYSNEVTVTVEDKTSIETKNSILYVGQKWDPKDNFVNATDEDGKSIPWEDPRITKNGASIDTSKPGEHKIKYTFQGKVKNVDSEFTVTVKEDKTSLELNVGDHYIYQGEQWDPKRGLKKATDADGNILSIDKIRQWWGGDKPVDPNKVGDMRTYFYGILKKDGSYIYNNVYVNVKEDKTSIETKNSILYVGQKWDPKDNFVNATDEDGKSIPWEDPRITKNGASIDTSKPGEHKIKYTFQGKVKNVDSEFTVTVKEEPFTIKQVPYFDFEDHILVSTNKSVVNKKENPTIDLETPSIEGKDWQLQVELSPFLDKKNSKSILKGVSLYIPKGKLESDLETEEPTQYDCQLEANGKASILMHGTKTKGKGRWKNKLATKEITLSIPPENKKGNYESTLHWTLLDVPG
ncbi:bacterial Ig-like domain-containing protein [Enterococcus faecalis]|uniref:bacterial Ig-like domain-containing protein n=1 Tax=Enterococcus faecalis TaxID=1351 RepID=UPI00177B8EFE|nr:bacterial Ig-like domain-containing protein [Enterococcus faecalis]MBD9927678.1 bacterial Ig-like domain-containing protein [Enterococcus faecalis]